MISFIIPCHNRLGLLKQLVNSIPIRDDIEVILVDDYSTEDLTKIDLSVFPSHKYIQNRTCNRFAGSARNIGIENSSGEYLFFADSDDLVISDGFVKCLEMLKNEKPDILFAKVTSFYDRDNNLGIRHIRSNWLVNRALNGANQSILVRFSTPWAKFIRKDFVEKHKIRFENQSVSNDVVFAALLVVNQPVIQVCDDVVYSIRQGNPSLTNDYSVESTETRLQALLRYNMVLSDNGLSYLMAPALPFLVRLIRKKSIKFIYWAINFLTKRQPVFFTWWTLKNFLFRYLSKSV
jgi:glycosyltransferase involved in cell wall biosynthesis